MEQVRIGCSGWIYDHWRGRLYAEQEPKRRWLELYAQRSDTVEVNATFYRLARRETGGVWLRQTPPQFMFAVNASRYLTHVKRLVDIGGGVRRFYEPLQPLLDVGRLGPVLWQLPENFHRDDGRLQDWLVRRRDAQDRQQLPRRRNRPVAVSAAKTVIPDGTFVEVSGTPDVYEIGGDAPLLVNDWAAVGGVHPVIPLTAAQFDGLNSVPAAGTFLTTDSGTVYRVAGGAPPFVGGWSGFGGAQPAVLIDQWDIDNVGNPLAHLNPIPANGAFPETTTGGIYRVAGGAALGVSSWGRLGGIKPAVVVDEWDIDHTVDPPAHLNVTPALAAETLSDASHPWLGLVACRPGIRPPRVRGCRAGTPWGQRPAFARRGFVSTPPLDRPRRQRD